MEYEISVLIGIFKEYKEKIYTFKSPEELFGELSNGNKTQLEILKEKYKTLLIDHSADKYNHYNNKELFDISSDISQKIIELYKQAEDKINNETYGKKVDIVFIENGTNKYEVFKLESQEDFAETFQGINSKTKEDVWIKASIIKDENDNFITSGLISSNNEFISNEIRMLKRIDSIKDDDFQKVRKQHFPIMIDNFELVHEIEDYDTINQKILVAKRFKDVKSYDLVTLREKFKKGIPLYHGCWILARMLSAIGHLHSKNIIHGNIQPSGIFIIPKDHNVVISNFEFSIIDYTLQSAKYVGITNQYSAPEIDVDIKPHPRTDLYSIGMTVIYLLGGDIKNKTLPKELEMIDVKNINIVEYERGIRGIQNLILSFVNNNSFARSDDAWRAWHQLSDLRKAAFGKQTFIKFNVLD